MLRQSTIKRKTKETNIQVSINLDGKGILTSQNPIPFFEHMLSHLAKYSLIDMDVQIAGDIEIDCHHSVEDTGIILGEAIKESLGDKKGIFRYGHFTLPMDEVLTTVAVDFCNRPYFQYKGPDLISMGKFGIYDSELSYEFLHKLSIHASMNLHVIVHYGKNRHHIHESIFKALGFAIRNAIAIDTQRGNDVPSTKGLLS